MDRNPDLRPTETAEDRTILSALRRLNGKATLGDVMARTGLAQREAESSLRRLLEARRGHLEVGETGTLVYNFDPRLVRRSQDPLWSRIKRTSWSWFKTGFKVWTVLMLVVYFVLFVVLLLAAMFAGKNRDGGGGGWGGGGGRHHGHRHGHFPSFWIWYLIWSPGWGWGRPYYGQRYEERHGPRKRGEPGVPFYKKVFAFIFGPDRPRPTQAQKDRTLLRLIRSRRGVVTVADVVQHTGLSRHEAEEELARLMSSHEGDVKVTGSGNLVYVFEGLMVSAHGRVQERAPDPAWRRLEPALSQTGNPRGTDLLIGAVNSFNLIAAASAPWSIFPRLGMGGPLAWVGLVWVPLVFSSLFFAIPLLRLWGIRSENRRRERGNHRKVLLSHVFSASLVGDGAQVVRAPTATRHVREALGKKVEAGRIEDEMLTLTAEFDAEVTAGVDGGTEYRFPELRGQFHAAEEARRALSLETREVGDIVYSSSDTPEDATARDLAAFERELTHEEIAPGAAQGADLTRYLPATNRVAYLDDFELVAFDEELKRRSARVA